ncbi:MAG TPA: L,D-transpeptidase family protein [Solirubrobacteraceae bacterium]|nr:L,D-transpeptidase family protein [Solirubrobacteraceae bacterium]
MRARPAALAAAAAVAALSLAPVCAAPPARAVALPRTQLAALPAHAIANGTEPLAVTLSAAVAPGSPVPMLLPKVAGKWSVSGDSYVFTPASTLAPCSSYTLTVWSLTAAAGHSPLGRRRTLPLRVACPPTAGLQQALARLGYLGATLRPLYDVHYAPGRESRREAAEHAFHPPRGRLAPKPAAAPPVRMGELDATTRGALEVFQEDNGLSPSGQVESATWSKLLFDVTVDKRDRQPYTWVTVSESLPETLWLHRGRRTVISTPVNTGVPGAETERGIFAIYARYVSTTMSGEDPDGTKYDVPDVPWVNYFNGGDAVHGYPRASYGFPQSNGCVELPIETARNVFGLLAIGDVVWVQ